MGGGAENAGKTEGRREHSADRTLLPATASAGARPLWPLGLPIDAGELLYLDFFIYYWVPSSYLLEEQPFRSAVLPSRRAACRRRRGGDCTDPDEFDAAADDDQRQRPSREHVRHRPLLACGVHRARCAPRDAHPCRRCRVPPAKFYLCAGLGVSESYHGNDNSHDEQGTMMPDKKAGISVALALRLLRYGLAATGFYLIRLSAPYQKKPRSLAGDCRCYPQRWC